MKNQKEINDCSFIRMVLESAGIIIKEMGNKNGSLIIEEKEAKNVSKPLLLDDLFNPTKVPSLVSNFKIPDGKGDLISLYFITNQKIILKVRDLDQAESNLYGHIIFRKFNNESNASMLKYFYNVVTFVSCYVARENLLNDLAVLKKTYLEMDGKTEVSLVLKSSAKSSFERKESEVNEFNNKFYIYLTGEHLFEKLN